MRNPITYNEVADKIISFQNTRVILDSDVAELYGLETKRVNEAMRNNPHKFPEGYVIPLSRKDWQQMKTKSSTSLAPGGKVKLPVAFSEKGLYMLATILKSKRATETTMAIVEAFAKLRAMTGIVSEIASASDSEKQKNWQPTATKLFQTCWTMKFKSRIPKLR